MAKSPYKLFWISSLISRTNVTQLPEEFVAVPAIILPSFDIQCAFKNIQLDKSVIQYIANTHLNPS